MEKYQNSARCAECGSDCSENDCFTVDGKQICQRCLFGDVSPVRIYPIGVVVNDLSRKDTKFSTKGKDQISEIRLFPAQMRFTHKLVEESHICVIYYLHQSRPIRSRFKRGYDGKEVGVFASRTPDRLSPIAITNAHLLRIEDNILFVEGLDAINGSPVLDIKMSWPVETGSLA